MSDNLFAVVWIVDLGDEPDYRRTQEAASASRDLVENMIGMHLPSGSEIVGAWVGIEEWPERIIAAIGPMNDGQDAIGRPIDSAGDAP